MSDEKNVKGGGVSEKPVDGGRMSISPEEFQMFMQNVHVAFGEISAMCKDRAQLMSNQLDEYDRRLSHLEQSLDILRDSIGKKTTELRGDPKKPE